MTPDQIRAQLDRVLTGTGFEQADRAKAFLSFVVTAALSGHGNQIKETVIAVEALGRSTSFDSKTDPIVRVEAGRLRSRLKSYYDFEGAQDPILITLPKGSYVPEFSERAQAAKSPAPPHTRLSVPLFGAGLLAGLVLAGIAFLLFRRAPPPSNLIRLSLIAPPGSIIQSSQISPDGRMIAFTAFQQNRSMLWIRSLDSPESRIIPGTEAANQVFWSPDSRSLGFFTTDRLWRVDLAGGPAQQICPVTIPMGGGSWSRSGIIVFSSRPEGVLYKVPASGGVPQPATALDHSRGESMHRSPEFLPDGKHFLYVANSVTSGATTLRIGSVNSTDSTVLLESGGSAVYALPSAERTGSLLFYFQGMVMAQPFDPDRLTLSGSRTTIVPQVFYSQGRADFSLAAHGTLIYRPAGRKKRQLGWYDRAGRLIANVGERNDYLAIRLSPEDKRIVFIQEEPNWTTAVWTMDLASGRLSRVANLDHASLQPIWSPDGNEVIYANGNERRMRLLRQPISRAAAVAILDTPGSKFPTDWSANGQLVTYFTPWPDFLRLRTMILDLKNASARVLLEAPYNQAEAVFSPGKPGPRWIAYRSNEIGRPEVYVRNFPQLDQKWQISNDGGWQPLWRSDGRELFYLSGDGIVTAATVGNGPNFRADAPHPLFRTSIPPDPGRPEAPANSYAVSNDGQRFLVNQFVDDPSGNTISVVTDWQALHP